MNKITTLIDTTNNDQLYPRTLTSAVYDSEGNNLDDILAGGGGGFDIDKVYPVGSIYMSVNSTDPSILFGGTWEAWGAGRVPIGIDTSDTDFDTVEETGGAKSNSYTPAGSADSTTISVNQMPSHKHKTVQGYDNGGTASNDGFVYSMKSNGNHGSYDWLMSNTGGGQSHSHSFTGIAQDISTIQPYITCYMWKRTA